MALPEVSASAALRAQYPFRPLPLIHCRLWAPADLAADYRVNISSSAARAVIAVAAAEM
jgi:hypothetical protein